MARTALIIATLLLATSAPAQRLRAVRGFPDFSRILVIAAHPDDESLVAPLLGRQCRDGRSDCTMIVLTRGENGSCVLPGGCGSELAAVRVAELAKSTALLNVHARVWDFPDVMTDVVPRWDTHAGGHDAFVSRIRSEIDAANPTAIITFDPAHGSTCHPAHRAIGALVSEIAATLQPQRSVYFTETRVQFTDTSLRLSRGVQSASSLIVFDTADSWHYLIEVGRLYASQFTEAQIASLAEPQQFRSVVLMPLSAAAGARYDDPCP